MKRIPGVTISMSIEFELAMSSVTTKETSIALEL